MKMIQFCNVLSSKRNFTFCSNNSKAPRAWRRVPLEAENGTASGRGWFRSSFHIVLPASQKIEMFSGRCRAYCTQKISQVLSLHGQMAEYYRKKTYVRSANTQPPCRVDTQDPNTRIGFRFWSLDMQTQKNMQTNKQSLEKGNANNICPKLNTNVFAYFCKCTSKKYKTIKCMFIFHLQKCEVVRFISM